jgi:hypothetical protein
MTLPKLPDPAPGSQFGDLVVISCGLTTALCMCACGRKVRYSLKKLRQVGTCRTCAKYRLCRDTKRPPEVQKVKLTVEVPAQYAPRLQWLCERQGHDMDTMLKIAVERLLYSSGA